MKMELMQPINNPEIRNEEIHPGTPLASSPYIRAATSDNTRKAYTSDVRHFERWGGKLPASAEAIAQYLQYYANKLNPRTLARRLTALKQWHHYQGQPGPTNHPAIQKIMTGIQRIHGKPKQKAHPLSIEELLTIVKHLAQEGTLSAARDNALIQVGFFGAFRRSELVGIHVDHLNWKEEGIDILVPQSKTDQTHQGQYCALPYGKGLLCPVIALKEWLEVSKIKQEAIFREIKKGERLMPKALTPLSVNLILKKHATACGLTNTNKLSSHSLRRGLASNASAIGANVAAIMRQGRWKQINTVMEYIEANERFSDNAALKVLQAVKE
ncbi:MAG TPA: tyrosine-type recombinase/integrase [Gammaproteobacteria bacterium]|nr:tyrosine-type recombinase/integrase [Gammaproteobacteria bacterium]